MRFKTGLIDKLECFEYVITFLRIDKIQVWLILNQFTPRMRLYFQCGIDCFDFHTYILCICVSISNEYIATQYPVNHFTCLFDKRDKIVVISIKQFSKAWNYSFKGQLSLYTCQLHRCEKSLQKCWILVVTFVSFCVYFHLSRTH